MRPTELNWDNVELVVLMNLGDARLARLFERDGSEWWCQPNQAPQFMGRNEPPDFGERVEATGIAASLAVQNFLNSTDS